MLSNLNELFELSDTDEDAFQNADNPTQSTW